MKIVIAPDSFKGSLEARECEWSLAGWAAGQTEQILRLWKARPCR